MKIYILLLFFSIYKKDFVGLFRLDNAWVSEVPMCVFENCLLKCHHPKLLVIVYFLRFLK